MLKGSYRKISVLLLLTMVFTLFGTVGIFASDADTAPVTEVITAGQPVDGGGEEAPSIPSAEPTDQPQTTPPVNSTTPVTTESTDTPSTPATTTTTTTTTPAGEPSQTTASQSPQEEEDGLTVSDTPATLTVPSVQGAIKAVAENSVKTIDIRLEQNGEPNKGILEGMENNKGHNDKKDEQEQKQANTKTTVDHIDLNVKLTAGSETFTLEASDAKNIQVLADGVAQTATYTGESTDTSGNPQIRLTGNFPVGTLKEPVWYTVALTKNVTLSSGAVAAVKFTASFQYWSSNNACPGISHSKSEWANGGVPSTSGMDFTLSGTEAATGSIQIQKTLNGVTLAEGQSVDVSFKIMNSAGEEVTTETATIEGPSQVGYLTISNLEPGTYMVVETDAALKGYQYTTRYNNDATAECAKVEVSAGQASDALVENTYTPVQPEPSPSATPTPEVTPTPTPVVETKSITVTKVWEDGENQDGLRPDSITVQLLADGVTQAQTVTLNEKNQWIAQFTDLPVYREDGTEITYTAQEVSTPKGYTPEYTRTKDGSIQITNVHTPETINISGTKTWDDQNDRDGLRPDSITVTLMAGEQKVAAKVVTEQDGWKYEFTNLPKYDQGKEIVYTIAEDAVTGYTTKVDGYDLTNTHTSETTQITVVKTWIDNNDKAEKRPGSITVQLYADGKAYGDMVTITAADGWKHVFDQLPKYQNGKAVQYTVQETGVKYYVAKYTSKGDTLTITNTYVDIPMTGDGIHLMFWILMVLGAGAVLSGIGFRTLRRRT